MIIVMISWIFVLIFMTLYFATKMPIFFLLQLCAFGFEIGAVIGSILFKKS